MNKHRTDLLALLFGLAFTIAGALVIVTQATSIEVDPHWGAALGLIALGVVALMLTLVRARRDAVEARPWLPRSAVDGSAASAPPIREDSAG